MEKYLHFKDGKFKIMQIADTQEKSKVNPDTIKLIKLAAEREKPDLVVFTGDQIMGYSSSFKRNTKKAIRKTLEELTKPLSDNDITFCATFGNHDRDCGVSNNIQMNEIYKRLPGFICGKPASESDAGTYSLQIKGSDKSKNVFNLYIIDSNAKDANGAYSPVKKEQIKWYRKEREKIREENGNYLPSLVFQHIPVPEFYKVLKRCSRFTKGAVEAFHAHKNEFYILDDEAILNGGFMLESPATPDINNGEFEAMKEKGEVLGIFVGHDHINSFVKEIDKIKLGYTQGSGFNTYGPGANRGVRIFVLDENNLRDFKTYTVTMRELCNFKPSRPIWEFLSSHAPSSVEQVKRIAIKTASLSAAVFTSVMLIRKIMK